MKIHGFTINNFQLMAKGMFGNVNWYFLLTHNSKRDDLDIIYMISFPVLYFFVMLVAPLDFAGPANRSCSVN